MTRTDREGGWNAGRDIGAPAQGLPSREEIGRCIDPRAWNDIHVPRRDLRQKDALEKADAILALRTPAETDWQCMYEAETRISAKQAAEIVQFRALVEKLHRCASLLFQNAVGCCENHHGIDIKSNGYPGWLRDIGREIDSAQHSSTVGGGK